MEEGTVWARPFLHGNAGCGDLATSHTWHRPHEGVSLVGMEIPGGNGDCTHFPHNLSPTSWFRVDLERWDNRCYRLGSLLYEAIMYHQVSPCSKMFFASSLFLFVCLFFSFVIDGSHQEPLVSHLACVTQNFGLYLFSCQL